MTETLLEPLSPIERSFIDRVWRWGSDLYRDLPWRNVDDPYAVLVSEVMLQQTQVVRVVCYWDRFMRLFPTIDALAAADVALVLESWQGLGYNRRALALKRTADICARDNGGHLPTTFDDLLALPGIGKATASGVLAFAFDKPSVYLETNVRTVFIHEFFPDRDDVSDREIEPLVERTCSRENPRGWYYALLDYGAHLKATLPNPSRRSKHHSVQSPFEGSRRQKRAEIIRLVLGDGCITLSDIENAMTSFEAMHARPAPAPDELRSILDDLVQEGFFLFDEKERVYRSR